MGARWMAGPWGAIVALGLCALGGVARADVRASPITALLRSPRAHPLAIDGRVPLLVRLPPGVSPASRGLLELAPGLGAVHLPPEGVATFAAKNPDLGPVVAPPRRPLLNISHTWIRSSPFKQQTGLDGSGVVVGIIDTGLDVAHADFRDAGGKTRVAWLLRRGVPLGKHPELEQAYGCTSPDQSPCGIYSAADIDELMASNADLAPRDHSGHGTHITSIAAGNGGVAVTPKPNYVGVAPGATLIIAAPSGEGFADPDILNAARFIFDRAAELGLPAVVNVSLGSDFGPHDGTSELEKGLSAMVGDDKPGRALVVAAGNSGTLYLLGDGLSYGAHTEVHASPNALTRVPATIALGGGKVSGAGFVWITFRPGDRVSVGLEGPDGEWVGLVEPGAEAGYEGDGVNAAVINNRVGPNASITADSNSAVVAWDGVWQASDRFAVLLKGRGDAQLWITGTGGAAPGVHTGLVFERALKAGTIGVPASAPDLIAVGCTLNRVLWSPFGVNGVLRISSFGGVPNPQPDSTCYFSGAGPAATGAVKPDILAPGALMAGAMSRDADPRTHADSLFLQPGCPDDAPCYMVDERHAINSGTSMSAPHVTGAIALLMQRDPSLTQGEALEVLQAGARRPSGLVPYDYQQGPGELDLMGALQVLEEKADSDPEPSIEQSWYALSTPYARPDPTWPVRGTVELRHADGTIAAEVLGTHLGLHVDGGLVIEPLSRVRAGLWRFAVAAPRGSGGRVLGIDVRYRGRSLGARVLPIGVDAWAAGGGVKAVGGCSQPSSHTPPGWPWLAVLALAARRRDP